MASADHHTTNAAAADIFNDDEDLLDEDDDDESYYHDDNDSTTGDGLALSTPAAQVTIAVAGVPDPHLRPHQPQIIQPVARKPAQLDESRKLFQRLWNDEDEIELLQGFLDYTIQRGGPNGSSQHHHDTTAFYDQIKSKFQLDFNKNQLVEKLRRLKKKYRNVINKFGSGKEYTFKSPHEQATFEISSKIWGNAPIAVNGSAPASRTPPAPIDEDDEDVNNPNYTNFLDCQSPNLNCIDMNSKAPRPRKRNRAGAVKAEDTNHHFANININNTPVAAPPLSAIGPGIAGSLSSVIEETVKSCLSPIFKELLGNSMNSISNHNGLSGGNGFGLGRGGDKPSWIGLGRGGDKASSERWRKQQILELEVFSKRVELVQDQIREQLQELRSKGIDRSPC